MASTTEKSTSTDITQASTPELFSGLLADAKEIAVGHLGRMRGEIGHEFKNLKRMMAMTAAAVGVVIVGAVLIGHALAFGLAAAGLPVWVGYLVASVLMIGIGILVLKVLPWSKEETDLVPEDALASLQDDVRQVRRSVESH